MVDFIIYGVLVGVGMGSLLWLLGLACTAIYSVVFKHNYY